jgi:hypothetical protein
VSIARLRDTQRVDIGSQVKVLSSTERVRRGARYSGVQSGRSPGASRHRWRRPARNVLMATRRFGCDLADRPEDSGRRPVCVVTCDRLAEGARVRAANRRIGVLRALPIGARHVTPVLILSKGLKPGAEASPVSPARVVFRADGTADISLGVSRGSGIVRWLLLTGGMTIRSYWL